MDFDLTQVVIAVIGLVATWAIKELATWLRGRAKTDRERELISRLENTVVHAVRATAQTVAKEAKRGDVWNASVKAEVKRSAINLVKESLSSQNLKDLATIYGNEKAERLIDNMIESRVLNLNVDSQPMNVNLVQKASE